MEIEPTSDWRFESRLPWPGVRGRRLWHHITTSSSDADVAAATPDGDVNADRLSQETTASSSSVRYDVEMCEATAGHVALVLLRRDVSTTATTASAAADPVAATRRTSTPTGAAQLGIPRVLYVVDAVPPSATRTRGPQQPQPPSSSSITKPIETKWTMLSSTTRAHSFGGSTSTTTADAFSAMSNNSPQQHTVDELALIEELFTTARATKDACILAKPPLLCARFDCRLVAVRFSRNSTSSGNSTTSTSNSTTAPSAMASPLRCVVAREDGMCYIWEWSGDLQTWSFLNRFCFLENPNLKWTRPVLLFAAVQCPTWNYNTTIGGTTTMNSSSSSSSASGGNSSDAVETTELAWWSAETKNEPRLFVRKIQFGVEKSTFRTEIRIGSAFEITCGDVETLRSSSRGLWIISRTQGIRLRSVTALCMLQLNWEATLHDTTKQQDVAGNGVGVLTCVHSVTGELLVLQRSSGRVFVVTLSSLCSRGGRPQQLVSKRLLTIATSEVHSVAAHRQLLLTLLDQRVVVYSLVSGQPLVSLPLPSANWPTQTPLSLWTTSSSGDRGGGASAVGLFGASGYWQLHTPSAHALVALHKPSPASSSWSPSQEAKANTHALRVARPYGSTLEFETARIALDLLQSASALVGNASSSSSSSMAVDQWEAAIQSLSSPALLLATLKQSNAPTTSATSQTATQKTQLLLDDVAELVAAIYRVTHEIVVTGRFGAAVEKRDDPLLLRGLPFVTPANVEALHHLANWVLLATRRLARLRGSVVHKGSKRLRARTVSSLTTFPEDGDAEGGDATGAMMMPSLNPLRETTIPKATVTATAMEMEMEESDASSSRLSRKLRPMTSLQFAAGSCSVRHGRQWLTQLESLLLPSATCVPHALLFHEERTLSDFQLALSSFSKHLYFESMARLYAIHDPHRLVAFVKQIAQLAPRLFTLSGATRIVRSHAERALALLPPAHVLVQRAQDQQQKQTQNPSQTQSHKVKKSKLPSPPDAPNAVDSLLAYAELLVLSGSMLEACRVLLDADLYDDCVAKMLLPPVHQLHDDRQEDDDQQEQTRARETAVFFALLSHCVARRDARDLESLLSRKPRHVDALLVLRSLKQLLPRKIQKQESLPPPAGSGPVSVGALRHVLLGLLHEHKQDQATKVACR